MPNDKKQVSRPNDINLQGYNYIYLFNIWIRFHVFFMYDFRPREKSFILYVGYTDALFALKYGHHAIWSFLEGSEGCCTVHVGRMERTLNWET